MPHRLSADSTVNFKSKFNFFDALIKRVAVIYSDDGDRVGELELSVRDIQADDRWVNLILRLYGLREARLIENRSTLQVMSDGLGIEWINNSVYLVFCPYTDEPEGVDDIRRSNGYLAGERCEWEVISNS